MKKKKKKSKKTEEEPLEEAAAESQEATPAAGNLFSHFSTRTHRDDAPGPGIALLQHKDIFFVFLSSIVCLL